MNDFDPQAVIDSGKKSLWHKAMILISCVVVFAAIPFALSKLNGESISHFRIANKASLHFTSEEQLQKILQSTALGKLFEHPPDDIKQRLKQELPWIKEVWVRKIYPQKIELFIQEYDVWGLFNDTMISSDGHVFLLPEKIAEHIIADEHLPRLRGLAPYSTEMMKYWAIISQHAEKNGYHLLALEQEEPLSIQLIFAKVRLIILTDDVTQRIDTAFEFISHLPEQVQKQAITIDARFKSGLSVQLQGE